jgi:hypothetical protein
MVKKYLQGRISLENQKYHKCGYTIVQYDENMRIELFEEMLDEYVKPYMCANEEFHQRSKLKTSINSLSDDDTAKAFAVLHDSKLVGLFVFREEPDSPAPVADHVFIIKKYRKTKVIACIIDYALNVRYKSMNVRVDREAIPGMRKLIKYESYQDLGFSLVDISIADRASKICNKA